jgi:mannose-6-phosphate isomerase-like protein (cupin superfamily)
MKEPIDIESKFGKVVDLWAPKVIAQMNDYQFKLVKVKGEFVSHQHAETDEVFIVFEGKMNIEFEDETVEVNAGEMIVVPKGERHRPFAEEECKIMLIEPAGTVNTGDAGGTRTAPDNHWI